MNKPQLKGAGLGLRREHMLPLMAEVPPVIQFFEISPENYLDLGGKRAMDFRWFSDRYPVIAHGLSLSIGGPDPLDVKFLLKIKSFMKDHRIRLYTEHLSYCTGNGHLYDLFPIPFTEDAVHYVAARIRQAQDILEQHIAIENASYYAKAPMSDLSELNFIKAILEEADCWLHLDVNNIYVNSINHGYDPAAFLLGLPGERIVYGHVAGHDWEGPDLIIDTHGQAVIEPVWSLLELAYVKFGLFPTLLERDFNIPPLVDIVKEVEHINRIQNKLQMKSFKLSA